MHSCIPNLCMYKCILYDVCVVCVPCVCPVCAEANPLWRTICREVKSRGRLLDHLPLQCFNHTENGITEARTAADFLNSPHGGCKLPCNTQLGCGHVCKLLCHPASHDLIKCSQPCLRPRPVNCVHACAKICGVPCGPCPVLISQQRTQCKHFIKSLCSVDVNDEDCPSACGAIMTCGHNCRVKCDPLGHSYQRHACISMCNRVPLCGHPCMKMCAVPCGKH